MPPLMGAGAFVMVELTGVPYTEIMAGGAAAGGAVLRHGLGQGFERLFPAVRPERPWRPRRTAPPGGRDVSITSAFFLDAVFDVC
jgi:hypothetical protein